jgi:hypothetical protein
MQELMVYAGQTDCYENCNDVIDKFLNIAVSSSQVHRVTDTYGKQIGKTVNAHTILTPLKKEEVLYIEADGSMLLTREEGWKEVKLGRLFKAYLGNHKNFTSQMEHLIDSYGHTASKLVFITDGAPWLKNWIEDAYPSSHSILDYYHACEYLHAFSREHFADKTTEQQWTERQKELLLEGRVKEVIKNVKQLNSSKREAQKLVEYYQANIDRMDYKEYKKTGCGIIGSGAIESAHRKVIQKRMKQSGQRWSKEGAQNMLNLRVIKCNQQWEKIVALTKTEFRNAA